jgi:hypothetical protein
MENDKIHGDEYNLIGGKLKKSIGDLENIKDFINRWEKKTEEIKKISLDNTQSYNLANEFLREWDKFMHLKVGSILSQLGHDLFFAITQSNNNYKKEFPSFLQSLNKLKLPDLHFHKNR